MLRYQHVGGAFTSTASRFENTLGMERNEMKWIWIWRCAVLHSTGIIKTLLVFPQAWPSLKLIPEVRCEEARFNTLQVV